MTTVPVLDPVGVLGGDKLRDLRDRRGRENKSCVPDAKFEDRNRPTDLYQTKRRMTGTDWKVCCEIYQRESWNVRIYIVHELLVQNRWPVVLGHLKNSKVKIFHYLFDIVSGYINRFPRFVLLFYCVYVKFPETWVLYTFLHLCLNVNKFHLSPRHVRGYIFVFP